MNGTAANSPDGEPIHRAPGPPPIRPLHLGVSLLVGAVAVWAVSAVLPGTHVKSFLGAVLVAALGHAAGVGSPAWA